LDNHVFAWRIFFACCFWAAREELSVERSNNHVVLEGKHFWAMCYVGNEAWVRVKWVVIL